MSLDPNKITVSSSIDIKPKIEVEKGRSTKVYTKEEIKEILKYKIRPVKKYLYEADYDDVDYQFAKEYFDLGKADVLLGVCSAVRKDNLLGRKFDWLYNEGAEFVVRTPAANGRNKVFGVAGASPKLTDEFVKSGEYDEVYRALPFFLLDGENEHGVFCEINVVPADKGETTLVIPTIEERDRINSIMFIRYVLDNFKTADEAIDYIQKYVAINVDSKLHQMHYECHYLLGDKNKTYVVEFINNRLVAIEHNISTNFYISGVTFNEDGRVYTPANVEFGHYASENGITLHGSGLERYNLIVNNYEDIETKEDMASLMDDLTYTNAYKVETFPQWYTEFVGERGLTVDSSALDYETPDASGLSVMEAARRQYQERTRDQGSTWQSTHSSIYDLEKKKLYLTVQEDGEELEFDIDRYYNAVEIDKKLDNVAGGVNVLPEVPELTEKSVSQLYRFINNDESVDNLYMVNKDLEKIGVQSRIICKKNGEQLNVDTLLNNFESTYIDIFGDAVPETVENIYSSLYTIDGEKINMVRIGTKNPGTIVLTNLQNNKIRIIAGQYYSYNGSTGEKNYESGVLTINGVEHTLTQEPTDIEVEITDGTLTLSCGGSSDTGRGFLYGFKQYQEETVIHYNLEGLVSETMMSDAINKVIDYVDKNAISRVATLEEAALEFVEEVDRLDKKIKDIRNNMGDIQFNDCIELPTPREEMLSKVFRLNGDFYQCIAEGTGGSDTYSFAVSGTSEITVNNWNDFANGVGDKFKETFTPESTEKFYRNNTEVKFGSSSAKGSLVLVEKPAHTDMISFEVRGWSATKVSIFSYRIENTEDPELVVEGSVELTGDVDFHTVDLPIGFVVDKITFGSLKEGATDARVCVKSMTITAGSVEYHWSKINKDTVWEKGTGTNSIQAKDSQCSATGDYSLANGYDTHSQANASHSEGANTIAAADYSHAEGKSSEARGVASHTEGYRTKTQNQSEHASGQFNISHKATSTFGDAGNTLFSVGNGTSTSDAKNAFEIYQDGHAEVQSSMRIVNGNLQIGNTILTEEQLTKLLALIEN